MEKKQRFVFSNGHLVIIFIVVFAYLGGVLSNFFYYVAPCLGVFTFCLDTFVPKFNKFMDSKVKLYEFIKIDFKPNFIKSYMMLIIMLIIVSGWAISDYSNNRRISSDVFFAFFSIYVIFSTMILIKYYKKYEELP
jgi:hypothetical protein